MNQIKRIISVFLCGVLACSAFSVSFQAKSVRKYVKSISVKKKAVITIPALDKTAVKTYKVKVKVNGKASKKFTAKSSKKSVASVKVKGSKINVTAKKAGTAKITVTTKAKNVKNKRLKKTLFVTVKKAAPFMSTIKTAYNPEYQKAVKEKMKELKFNGIVRVTKNNTVVCELANGSYTADSEQDIAVDSQFALGSVSKQFTAACIMLLKRDGKIKLNDTIDKWYPGYKYAKKITIKNLLTMRSGIRDYVNDADSNNEYYARYNYSETATGAENRKATRDWIFSKELDFTPNSKSVYSNSNYFLLAEIVEKVSKTDFIDYLRKNILNPLKMKNTGIGYEFSGSNRLVPPVVRNDPAEIYVKGIAFGDGSIVSSGADMDRWMTSLRDHTVLKAKEIKEMTTDYSENNGIHYGFGFMIESDGAFGHEGAIDSYLTHEFTSPKEKYNLFIATNNDNYNKLSSLAQFAKQITR